MRHIIPAVLALLAGLSSAYARQSTVDMSCAQAAAVVASRGAVVLTTGEHTYERFVAHVGFCSRGEQAQPAYAPTLDTRHCSIGYVCEYRNRLHRD